MKRFLSILLCSAILAAAIPGMYYAEGNQSSYDELSQLKEIDYQLNGGHYVSGYNAPDKYPAEQLPDKDDIVNQGYEFGGWYDNKELTGSPVTEISEENYTGVVVLYAKWIERYYYIDIPESVDADKTNLTVSGHAGGLYEKDKVSVSVYSKNEWNLLNGDVKLGYELYSEENKLSLTNNSVITELTATGSDKTRKYMTRLQEIPKYAGIYTDNLTFDISFETTKYNIKYETNGGTLYTDDKDEQGRAAELDNSVYEAGTKLSDLPVPGKAGSTFLGWCYDADCTDYVASTDRLLSDVVLYASWVDGQELKTVSIDTYARSYDVDANDFTITVTDKSGRLTKEEVKNKVSVKNVSDSSENTSIDITAGSVLDDGAYTFIIKCNGTWQEGCGYRLELSDDRLYFTGYDQTIREYDFTVYKPDVTNVNLRDDIKYIKSGSLSNLYVNGEFLNSYDADGLIVSTPTGSTAYNLSAGGPIVEPTASLIVVTPICSHALNSRSIVFADKDEIVIEIGAKRENQIEEAVIAYDGADEVTLHTGDRIRIKKAWETAKIIKLSKVSFLETLREKMKGN